MKRNTKDELRYPVNLKKGKAWYYVEEKIVHVFIDGRSGGEAVKIPRKRLERLMRIK